MICCIGPIGPYGFAYYCYMAGTSLGSTRMEIRTKNSAHLARYKFCCPNFRCSAGLKRSAGSEHLELRVYGLEQHLAECSPLIVATDYSGIHLLFFIPRLCCFPPHEHTSTPTFPLPRHAAQLTDVLLAIVSSHVLLDFIQNVCGSRQTFAEIMLSCSPNLETVILQLATPVGRSLSFSGLF